MQDASCIAEVMRSRELAKRCGEKKVGVMLILKRSHLVGAGVVVLLFALTIGLPWLSPARGVDRAWHTLLDDIEGNEIEDVAAAIDADYADAWGMKREDVVKVLGTMRRQFLTCSITRDAGRERTMSADKRRATIRAVVRVDGTGSPVAQMIVQASQEGEVRTTFEWVRRSGKPWDWTLVRIDNPQATAGVRRLQREIGN
jgi:hypothetical protein